MAAALRAWWRSRWQRWLERRIPRSHSVTLDQRRIFIFPGRRGFLFGGILLLLFLGGINYGNNQILLLCFLLASLGHTAILHTYRNLSGLTFSAGRASPGFAGEQVDFELVVGAPPARAARGILLRWGEQVLRLDIDAGATQVLRFSMAVQRRGPFVPPRLEVQSWYPLGIIRAWSYVALDSETLVWPRPLADDLPPADAGSEESSPADGRRPRGIEEFDGLARYVPGDSLTRVDWRVYARSDELWTKQFSEAARSRLWLDFAAFAGDTEARLSRLTWWAVELERREQPYGLRLPGTRIAPAQGEEHHLQVLGALAMHGLRP